MRGKDVAFDLCRLIIGITPAYAGKRNFFDFEVFKFEDHPRLCGEKKFGHWVKLWKRGSPPPMRGKAGEIIEIPVSSRITPAYAGKSFGGCR